MANIALSIDHLHYLRATLERLGQACPANHKTFTFGGRVDIKDKESGDLIGWVDLDEETFQIHYLSFNPDPTQQ